MLPLGLSTTTTLPQVVSPAETDFKVVCLTIASERDVLACFETGHKVRFVRKYSGGS